MAVFRDVTDRRSAEAALRESEERFRNAFDHAPSGMYLGGLDGRWLRVNQALCRMVGRTEEEMEATTWQAVTHPDDIEPDLANVRNLLAGEVTHYHMEKRYLHKRGHAVWVLQGGGLVRDARVPPLYFVGHVHDIAGGRRRKKRCGPPSGRRKSCSVRSTTGSRTTSR